MLSNEMISNEEDQRFVIMTAPQLGINEPTAQVARWYVQDGAYVSAGDPCCALETTKVVFDLEAEVQGYVGHLVEVGWEVHVSQPVAVIASSLELLKRERAACGQVRPADSGTSAEPDGAPRATRKALAAARRLGVDLSTFSSATLIREEDVLRSVGELDASPVHELPALQWQATRRPVAVYGAAGGALTLKEALEFEGVCEVVCFLDDNVSSRAMLSDLPIFHGRHLCDLSTQGVRSIACEIADGRIRHRLLTRCLESNLELITIVHPMAYVAPSARLGKGNYVKSGACVETNVRVGDCCIIDNGVTVAHDSVIGNGCHLAPGATLGSRVVVEDYAVVGIGASVATGTRIGQSAIISVGTAVTRDVSERTVLEGVPGKRVGTRKDA
ncbi:MAG: hypothetical protein FI707_14860 [SAR202 cluster bacterium]|nr:hypothetical protein [Acidobacteriota bacterium]MQG70056.1 hypothetical protein [SAR202 cluster bacterium]HAL47143.1 hypothetical protein [Dehalococcoidia bacterium]